jgi:SAM-dependent methyltransferase
MQQKDIFLESEADAWFQRNQVAIALKNFATDDPVTATIIDIAAQSSPEGRPLRVLEVGCGEGSRLSWLADQLSVDVYGVEPSTMAVEQALAKGVKATRGTADTLPYEDGAFDVLIYGFCLYLCDRQDLFRIAQEADRVLKSDGWLVIHDFFASTAVRREYHHKSGVFSYKMDYRKLFDWHPAYTCFSHKVGHHGQASFTDNAAEWVSTSVLRKKADVNE